MPIHRNSGRIVQNRDGKVARSGGPVCVACANECPTDCSTCFTTYTVEIVSLSNPSTGCFIGTNCGDQLDGVTEVFVRGGGDSCTYTPQNDLDSSLQCQDLAGTRYWTMAIASPVVSICQLNFWALMTDVCEPCCPPVDVDKWTDVGGTCHGTISIVAS